MSAAFTKLLFSVSDGLHVYMDMLSGRANLEHLLFRYGWLVELEVDFEQEVEALSTLYQVFAEFVNELEAVFLAENTEEEQTLSEKAQRIFTSAKAVYAAVMALRDLSDAIDSFDLAPLNSKAFWEDFSDQLLADILVTCIKNYAINLYTLLQGVGVIEERFEELDAPYRVNRIYRSFNGGQLSALVTSPLESIKTTYGWKEDQLLEWEKLFEYLTTNWLERNSSLIRRLPRRQIVEAISADASLAGVVSSDYALRYKLEELFLPIFYGSQNGLSNAFYQIGIALMPISTGEDWQNPPSGFLISPIMEGEVNQSIPIATDLVGHFQMSGSGNDALALAIYPDKTEVLRSQAEARMVLALEGRPASPWVLLGSAEGHRLEIHEVEAKLEIASTTEDIDVSWMIRSKHPEEHSKGIQIYIQLANSDSFLSSFIDGDISAEFDLDVQWSSKKGFSSNSGFSLNYTFPFSKRIGNVRLKDINLFFHQVTTDRAHQNLRFTTGTNLSGKLGPVSFEIQSLGFAFDVIPYTQGEARQLPSPPLLGLLDLDLSFAPPTGLGFSIDAKVVKGGGFLSFDRDKGEYIGFAELQVLDTINVKAIGIINTKLPDGQAGYSFLLMVVSEFQPLQLGLGFTLEGVGGIVGLHRGLNLDNIRGAVSSGEFDYILFPEDALANLPKIIAGLNLILPIQKNHYAFGLMARFGWGSPKMLDIKLGLLFELPNWKLALIGVAKAEIKRGEKLLARLQLDFAITYDPGEAFFSFDAQLKNSKLLIFELSGDFAIRIKGGDDPQFLISAGGFHKDYQPPASLKLPAMQRLKIAMKSGNPTIQAEAFFAITTNTFQFGAAAVAKYNKSGISFYAELGFAALIQFDPLYFKAEVWGAVELDFWGAGFGLELRGTIEGPYPIHFDLYVKFKIWIFSFTVRIPKITIGSAGSPALPKVDIWPLLEQQLADNRNWQAVMPVNRPTWVSFRSSPDGTGDSTQVRIHPLATITISQSQVPLRIPIERFGAQQPADYQNFSLELAGTDLSAEAVREFFAPAQYFNLTEEERFRTKAYEKYEGGLRIDAWDSLKVGAIVEKVYDYETKIIVDNEVASHRAKPLKDRAVQTLLEHSSQAQSTAGRKDQRRGRQRMRFRRQTSAFALVHLLTDEQLATAPTQQEAEVLRRNRESSEPHLRGQLAIIPLHELETA